MADTFQSLIDLKMTEDGDLAVEFGDLAQTRGVEWFTQEVRKIVRTNNPDWVKHPNIGADLEEFAGLPNTRDTAGAIQRQLHDKITAENIHFPGELEVRVVPISADGIAVYIRLTLSGSTIPIDKVVFEFAQGVVRDMTTDEERSIEPSPPTSQNTVPSSHPFMGRI